MHDRIRLFVDMDGTLAEFKKVEALEELYEKGYFRDLRPQKEVVEAVKAINKYCKDIEVNILSSYLTDSEFALEEKNQWLDEYLPEVDMEHRIFVPCGENKKNYVHNHGENCFLLDDYTKNLIEWEPPGKGIKLLNGINHTRGTWKKSCIDYNLKPEVLAARLVSIMDSHIVNRASEKFEKKKLFKR